MIEYSVYSKGWDVKDHPDAQKLREKEIKRLIKEGWEITKLSTYRGKYYGLDAKK